MKRMNNLKNVIAARIMGGLVIGMTVVAGVAPVTVFAQSQEAECICEEKCSQDSINEECAVCLYDYNVCQGVDAHVEGSEECTETAEESYGPLTPDGNMNLVDDYGSIKAGGKQFITVTTKSGNYFYIIIDRDDKGTETVHFLNLVDESDLLKLMEDDEVESYMNSQGMTASEKETEEVKSTEATEEISEKPKEKEKAPETGKKKNVTGIMTLVLIAAIGGIGGFMYMKPDAQLCQSFTGWKQMGRYVKKGEKGISILAPAPYKIEREQTKLDEKGRPVFDADGEPVKEKVEVTIRAFKVVKTFDLSQTDGKELPTIGPSELVGNIEGYPKLLQALQEISPVPVSFELIDGDAKGFYHLEDKKIVVQDGMSEVQTIKTLLHEMAHQKLHDKDNVPEAKDISRNGKEVEAESVAYVVCQHYGINTSDYSFSYVAGWSEGKETPELKASLDKIRQTASEFIYQIDQKMEVLMADKEQGKETAKVKESVKSKLKSNTKKAEQAPKKSRTSKAKEERA